MRAMIFDLDGTLIDTVYAHVFAWQRAFAEADMGIDAGVADVSLTAESAEQNDGLAYETGEYVIRVEPTEGARVVERGHYVQVYQRQPDGSWQRTVEIFSPGGGE